LRMVVPSWLKLLALTVFEERVPALTVPLVLMVPVAVMFPVTDWLPVNELRPSVANGEQVEGSAVSAPDEQVKGAMPIVTAPPFVLLLRPEVPVTLLMPPLPVPPQPLQLVTVRLPSVVVPVTVKTAGFDVLPKFTVGEPVGASTSRVALGAVVPIPTLTVAQAFAGLPPRTRLSR
jgi:hypothetical protein